MQSHLRPHPVGLGCGGCGRSYPVVDGMPVVLRDTDAWLQQEAIALILRGDLSDPVFARIAEGARGPLARDLRNQRVYAASQEGPLQDWMRTVVAELPRPLLDLGCGSAPYAADDGMWGLDLSAGMLRRYRGRRLVADALDPPFEGGSFAAVALFNLLDSCRDPGLALQQADALLAPGGTLALSCAFAWQDEITPAALRLDEAVLLGFLQARGYAMAPGYPRTLSWPLRLGPRTQHVHEALALVATR